MVDRAKSHVGPETSASEAMRLALREGALPRATVVREELARYAATGVGREGCAMCAAPHVGRATALPSAVREELATYSAIGADRTAA